MADVISPTFSYRNLTSRAPKSRPEPLGFDAIFTYGSAATRSITPNLRGMPAQILDMKSGTRRLDHQLGYDANGNLAGIIDGLDGMESRTLAYDERNRLTGITGTPGSIGNEHFAYDPLDNVRRVIAGGADRRFHYDAGTLRLTQVTTINSPVITDYSWNTRGELTGRTRTEPSTPPMGADTIFLDGFDASLLSSTETFGFDQARRLTGFPGGVTHTYDAHNHRVSTITPAWGTRYQVYSRSGELLYIEDSGSNQRTEFFHLNGTLVAERTRPLTTETAVVSYLHSDHRGTPTVKTDSASNVHYRSRLMPYGAPYDGIYREGPGFTKHATDDVVQLSYMQQRYYDPASMRFLSPDPIAAGADSFNVYAYANNNPYTFVDPDGRAACPKKSAHSCIDSPRTESGTTQQAGPSAEQRMVDQQVTKASNGRRLSDGTRLELSGREEQGFSASADGTKAAELTGRRCVVCSDGTQRSSAFFDGTKLGPGESGGHTHDSSVKPLPGPEDGGIARVTGKTAYAISERGAFAIERTDVGYRIRVIDGDRPTGKERNALMKVIDGWNQHSGSSGATCAPGC